MLNAALLCHRAQPGWLKGGTATHPDVIAALLGGLRAAVGCSTPNTLTFEPHLCRQALEGRWLAV